MPTTRFSRKPKWKVRSRPLREAAVLAQELAEEPGEVELAGGEDAQVAVHGQDPVVGLEGRGHPHRDGLLADAGEPLARASPWRRRRSIFSSIIRGRSSAR